MVLNTGIVKVFMKATNETDEGESTNKNDVEIPKAPNEADEDTLGPSQEME